MAPLEQSCCCGTQGDVIVLSTLPQTIVVALHVGIMASHIRCPQIGPGSQERAAALAQHLSWLGLPGRVLDPGVEPRIADQPLGGLEALRIPDVRRDRRGEILAQSRQAHEPLLGIDLAV